MPVQCTCSQCGKSITRIPSRIKDNNYCSKRCLGDSLSNRVDRICEICGTAFIAFPKDVRRGQARYCTRKCFGIALSTRRIRGNPRPRDIQEMSERACLVCRTTFQCKPSSRRKFCSKRCYGISKQGILRKPLPTPEYSDDKLTARFPLYDKNGSIRSYVVVDASRAEWAGRYRWYMDADGYAKRDETINGERRRYLMHREILGLQPGDDLEGDHINRNKLQNTDENLRIIPKGYQPQNSSSQKGSSSKYRGVQWNKGSKKWAARVTTGGKIYDLGRFDNEEVAAKAAKEARLRLMPYAVD